LSKLCDHANQIFNDVYDTITVDKLFYNRKFIIHNFLIYLGVIFILKEKYTYDI